MATEAEPIYPGTMIPATSPSPRAGIVLLVIMFVTANLLVPSMVWDTRNDRLICTLIGGLISEAVLLAIWASLGSDELHHRMGRVIVLFFAGWFTWQVGIRIQSRPIPIQVILVFAGAAILLEFLATGAGLVYRAHSGKQICHRQTAPRQGSRVFQFSIKQILGLTTVVAVSLMLSRFLFDIRRSNQRLWKDIPMLIGMGLVICTPILALMWLCLELALGRVSKIIFLLMIVFVIPVASVITLIAASMLMSERFSARAFGHMNSFFIGLALTTTLALTWVRWLGFRLVKRDEVPHPRTDGTNGIYGTDWTDDDFDRKPSGLGD